MTNYQTYIIQLLHLNAIILEHGLESKQAESLRNDMDVVYDKCSNTEIDCLRDLSARLNYTLDYFKDKPYD